MALRLAPLLAMLLLAACAAPQPSLYAPLDSRDGYAEQELGKGLYQVKFQGNSVTSRERAENYALYRAAEITLQLGKARFAVRDKLTERYTRITRETYDPWPYYGPGWGPYWRHGYYAGYYTRPSFRYERTTYLVEITVEPFTGPAPEGGFQIYEAQEVIDRLGPQIIRPEDVEES